MNRAEYEALRDEAAQVRQKQLESGEVHVGDWHWNYNLGFDFAYDLMQKEVEKSTEYFQELIDSGKYIAQQAAIIEKLEVALKELDGKTIADGRHIVDDALAEIKRMRSE